MKKGYSAYNLTDAARSEVLNKFPSKFSKVVAHHVTLAFNVSENEPIPPFNEVSVVGYACNEKIECLVVKVGESLYRPDGKLFHITLSHSEEAKPVDSNNLLMSQGFKPVEPFNLSVITTFNSF